MCRAPQPPSMQTAVVDARLFVKLKVFGHEMSTFVDTGAAKTYIENEKGSVLLNKNSSQNVNDVFYFPKTTLAEEYILEESSNATDSSSSEEYAEPDISEEEEEMNDQEEEVDPDYVPPVTVPELQEELFPPSLRLQLAAYENEQLDKCVSKTINQMFNEEEALSFIFDEYVNVELPKIMQNPYVIARSTNFTSSKLDRCAAYVLHLQNQQSLSSTLMFLNSSTFWILKQSPNNVYFVIINKENINDLQNIFTFFWSMKIHKVLVFTKHYSKNQSSIKLHTSNPFYKENICGSCAKVFHTQDCRDNITINFSKKYKNLNGCGIIFLTETADEPSGALTYLFDFFNELANTVNGHFQAQFSINKSTTVSIQMQPIIAVKMTPDHSQLFLTNDFSNTAFMCKLEFVVKGGEPISPVKILFIIFKTEVWIMIIVSILVTSIALWFITSFDEKQFIFSKLEEICSNVLLATIWGYFAKIPKNKGRYICICYLIYQMHIQTGFTSNLVTVLTTPQYKPGITNIEQLLNSDLSIIASTDFKEYYFADIGEPNSIYSKIKNKTLFLELEYNFIIETLHSGNSAMFLLDLDVDLMQSYLGANMHINRISTNFITGIMRSSYLMTPGHFFKETLNSFIRSRDESGITQKYIKKLYDEATVRPRFKKLVPLNMKHLLSYQNEQLEKCVSKTIDEMFNKEETITFVYDEYVDVEVPKIIQNPYAIARSTDFTRSKLDRNAAYIMHLQNQKSLNNIGKPDSIYSRIKNRTQFAELEYNEMAEALHSGNNALFLLDLDTNFMEAHLGGSIHINRIKANSIAGILRSSYLMTPGHYFKKTLNSFLRSMDESVQKTKNYEGALTETELLEELELGLSDMKYLDDNKDDDDECYVIPRHVGDPLPDPTYENEQLEKCVSKTINELFNEEETLTFVYDEYVDVEVPIIIQNPYAIARSTGSTRSKLDKNAAYIMHLQNQKSLNSTFEFLNLSTFWILRHSLNIQYFIIIKEQNFEDLQKTFTFLWSLKIHKIVVFTQHYSKNRNIIKIHTSNPFYKGNHCGAIANVIHSQDCSDNSTIQILEKYKNLNGCDIIFLTPFSNEPSCAVTYLLEFFNELADRVNGNFTAKFLINKTTAASIQKQPIIAVTLITDQSELFLTNDFSNTAFMCKLEFVVKGGERISPVRILFIIFKTEVWIMIIVSILVTSIALWFISSFDEDQFIFSKLEEVCSNVFLATIWGYFAKIPKNKGRYICICYLVYQIHIQTGFTSNLVTVLTTPQYKTGITNIEQLVKSNLSIIATESYKEYYFSDIGKPDSIYSRIKNRTQFAELEYNEMAEALHSGNNALFLLDLDTNFMEAHLGGSIHINRIKANSIAGILRSSYLMTPGHYFKKTLNSFLRSMDESGITQKNLKKMYDQAAVPPRIKNMEKSKLPILARSKPSSSVAKGSTMHQLTNTQQQHCDDIKLHRPVPTRQVLMRRSKSLADLKSSGAKNQKLIPNKPLLLPNRAVKTAPKRPAPTKPEAPTAPKVTRPAKIAPYDYKARYNVQVEKTTKLQTNLKEMEQQLVEAKSELANLSEEHSILEKKQFETDIKKLQHAVTRLEGECSYFRPFKVEKEKLEIENEKITNQLHNLKAEMSLKCKLIEDQEELLNSFKNNLQDLETLRRSMHNQIQDLKGSIRVFCRVRPKLPSEFNKLTCKLTYVDEDSLEITKENVNFISGRSIETPLEFVFNKVFQPECTQLEVFEELSQLIQSAIDGYNVCVFAYGQTGSGKTYTMQGDADQHIGIIPRSIDLVFKLIDKYRKLGWVYQVDVSFLEIYNETVRDLLTTNAKESLEIRYNEGRGTTVTNLTVTPVESATELYYLMKRANQNRAVAVTNYNEHSSRSHAVTKITLKGTNSEMRTILTGSLSLVDLAGSESAKNSDRIVETKNINKSLSALGTVMMNLQNKESHVPYRNSKLTYLLQSSLGGNSKTLMFVNISPLEECYGESVNALRFASKVKEVKIVSKRNKAYFKKENII
ncbi:hypothetical protein RN001_003880 [Aquatica leii]|uniref:Kinesin motor domain-containing protein n=1 Tax=Aquatica leii TaxID=1421715 RepID=A0AAN7SMJ1_9COLE|nr:hypothetical protein RN001_003880 [Aquatica leii]